MLIVVNISTYFLLFLKGDPQIGHPNALFSVALLKNTLCEAFTSAHPHSRTHLCVCAQTQAHLQESGLESVCVCVRVAGRWRGGISGGLLLACKSSEMFANRICLCLLECLTEIYIHI